MCVGFEQGLILTDSAAQEAGVLGIMLMCSGVSMNFMRTYLGACCFSVKKAICVPA